ncbi:MULTISPECIES: hypothetical protein [Methylocaldum]|jgi:hypothetical protein|uniref:hypothetical protein n=1 Tax=Methylocaldum sp. GT1TLB TaxID=3438965 RepID=UPI0012EC1E83|nr:hypothetical protein [Methylocaldum sp. BRCS4]
MKAGQMVSLTAPSWEYFQPHSKRTHDKLQALSRLYFGCVRPEWLSTFMVDVSLYTTIWSKP